MTNEEITKEVKDKISELNLQYLNLCKRRDDYTPEILEKELTDQILSLSGEDWELAIIRKKPELTNSNISNQDRNGETYAYYYNKSQQDMLKAGFRQEVK